MSIFLKAVLIGLVYKGQLAHLFFSFLRFYVVGERSSRLGWPATRAAVDLDSSKHFG